MLVFAFASVRDVDWFLQETLHVFDVSHVDNGLFGSAESIFPGAL